MFKCRRNYLVEKCPLLCDWLSCFDTAGWESGMWCPACKNFVTTNRKGFPREICIGSGLICGIHGKNGQLCKSISHDLIVPAVWLTSIGSRSFPVAGARIWNTLPLYVTSASSLTVFKQCLKLYLFCFSSPGLSPVSLLSGPCSVCCHLGHYTFFLLIDWLIDATFLCTTIVQTINRTVSAEQEELLRELGQQAAKPTPEVGLLRQQMDHLHSRHRTDLALLQHEKLQLQQRLQAEVWHAHNAQFVPTAETTGKGLGPRQSWWGPGEWDVMVLENPLRSWRIGCYGPEMLLWKMCGLK